MRHVERKSDGFEPFEEIMEQADKRTPPKPKGRNRKSSVPIQEDESDEDGEMSMELDDGELLLGNFAERVQIVCLSPNAILRKYPAAFNSQANKLIIATCHTNV